MTGTILAIADSDSYLKYAVHFLEHLPQWRRQVMVVRSPVQPTSVQTRSALEGTFLQGRPPAVLPLKRLESNANPAPDVVLVAATGPVAREVLLQWSSGPKRPALVTALPGIALPATRRALAFRELCDLFLVHSVAEAEEFARLGTEAAEAAGVSLLMPDDAGAALAFPDPELPGDDGPDPADAPEVVAQLDAAPSAGSIAGPTTPPSTSPAATSAAQGAHGGAAAATPAAPAPSAGPSDDLPMETELVPPPMALARLPMLRHQSPPPAVTQPLHRLVFAAQAKMPFLAPERRQVLLSLARTAREQPDVRVIMKLRAHRGEPQTHRERFPYDTLWDELVQEGLVRGDELVWEAGPLAPLLTPGTGLVTVSSTAAIEAVDRGLPVAILNDFGVDRNLLNAMFEGSGLLTSLEQVAQLRLATADPEWARSNYFHDAEAVATSGWPEVAAALDELAERARAGELSVDPAVAARARTRAWRARLRTRLPQPVLRASQLLRSVTG